MSGNGKDSRSSSSNNNSLDEIKALLNESLMISVRSLLQSKRSSAPPQERYTSRWNREKRKQKKLMPAITVM